MAAESALSGAKIIILDDEPQNVSLLERLLSHEGYTRTVGLTSSNDLFAPDLLGGADLLLLDLRMPPPDGFEVLQRLRDELDPRDQLPVMVLTSDASNESRNRALELGANDYLTKPFDRVEVLLRVRNLLRIRFLHLTLLKTNRVLQDRLLEIEGPFSSEDPTPS